MTKFGEKCQNASAREFLRGATVALAFVLGIGIVASAMSTTAYAQSAVTGAISGVVTDASGGALPGAQVVITDPGTNSKQVVVTNAEGRYTVGLLKPGPYKLTATGSGLKSDTVEVVVGLGTTVTGDIQVTPTGDSQIVDVSASSVPLLDTQNVALATVFTEDQIEALPTPGGDITTIAFTLPGVVVNAGGQYGNFSSNGLPGISNLFVLNGFDNQDPFLNLNNSGSSNLTLGQGEEADVTVVQNGYNSQFGRAAGAIIEYNTKSGSNKFHGLLDYNYNGTLLNANGWFNQYNGGVRPHAVSNQWAVNTGGPIIRDKVFFFADFEGLRYVLPATGLTTFPSAQLQSYILANAAEGSLGLFQQAFAAYQSSPYYSTATPVTNGNGENQDANGALGCGIAADGGLAGTPVSGGGVEEATGGVFGVDTPCVTVANSSATNINKEWLFTGRADWKLSDKHAIYGRYKMDRGSQPTSTSFINPLFSAVSVQPEYEGQFNDSFAISGNKTNVFVAAANWYSAYFGPQNLAASQAALPASFVAGFDYGYIDGSGVNGAPGITGIGVPFYLTQGRNVAQYQLEDDFNWVRGKHTLKLGVNFRRDLVSDYDSRIESQFPFILPFTLGALATGTLDAGGEYQQAFPTSPTAHLALYNLGAYFQDEFQAMPHLKLTMGVRIDRTGNPLCHSGCFSAYNSSFPSANASYTGAYGVANGGPVSSVNYHPFDKVEILNFQPRVGFNYELGDRTEIRGGAGLFSDLYPAGFLDGSIQNFPNDNLVTVLGGTIATSGAGSGGANAATANSVVQSGFASGASVQQINTTLANQGVPFVPPTIGAYFQGTFHVPEYLEYSLQIQRQLNKSDALIISYVGNYGYNEVIQNPYVNGATGVFSNGTGTWADSGVEIAGLPITPADPRFAKVTGYTNNAHSNYNGGMIAFKHSGHGLTGQISYTYSHDLDFVSNGGEGEPFNGGAVGFQLTPQLGSGNLNYSNADYDIRNNLVGDMVYTEPLKFSNKILNEGLSGWIVGVKEYYRSGEPFTITNNNLFLGNNLTNVGATLVPQLAPGVSVQNLTNKTASSPHSCQAGPCLDVSQFVSVGNQTTFGNLRRNSLYGPHYADTDVALTKDLVKLEGFKVAIGANAYNVFNHANFAAPVSDIGSGSFGQILSTLAPPTSPYGSFQGAAVTQRVLQVHGKITF